MSASRVAIDPEECWERTERAWEDARSSLPSDVRLEVYTRSSRRVRVWSLPGGEVATEQGVDEGTAVRVQRPEQGLLGFAASAGTGREVATWGARSAFRNLAPHSGPTWDANPGVRRDLRGGSLESPAPDSLHRWIREAVERAGVAPAADPWVESSSTVEAARTPEGGWMRSRRRIWAVGIFPPVAGVEAEPVPRVVAASDPETLPPDPWSPVADESEPRSGSGLPEAVVFDGEALAALVPALVGAVRVSAAAGPGWVVTDDPGHAASMVGGDWDDAGFPSCPLPLADGNRLVRRIEGAGTLRRGSFRDPPGPAPSLLVVNPPAIPRPTDAVHVHAVRVHPLEEGWVLEIDGVWRGSFSGARIRIAAESLVARCRGGLGSPGLRGGTVLSPALCFAPLPVEGGVAPPGPAPPRRPR